MPPFTGIASAVARGMSGASEIERRRKADEEARAQNEIQQAAMLAAFGEQGISRGGQGTPLGTTGYTQDPTMTKRAKDMAAQRQRAEMLDRRRSVLKARGVNPDEVDVEDDGVYESYAKFRPPEGPKAPVRGTPEHIAALDAEEGVRAKHRPARPTPRPARPNEKESLAKFMLPGAERAVETLKNYSASPRTWVNKVPGLGNYGQTEKDQIALQAAETLHDAYLRITTGATIQPDELRRAALQYVPQPGDSPGVLRAKATRRKEIVDAIRRLSSQSSQAPSVDDSDDDLPYDSYDP